MALNHVKSKYQKHLRISAVVYLIISLLVLVGGGMKYNQMRIEKLAMEQKITQAQQARIDDEQLESYTLLLMKLTRAKLSDFQKVSIAQALVRVSGKIFSSLEQRKWFAVLVANESHFNSSAKSSAGAVGLSQIIPKYAAGFGIPCGITGVLPTELSDVEINLSLGACQFRELINTLDGNTAAALVAYNAGQNSQSLKQLLSGSTILNQEAANYPSKAFFLRTKADLEEQKDAKPAKS
jgi:soluble lytic murein transglycosylase-like protein